MSKENRRKKYEQYKGTEKLSDALKREFEGEQPEDKTAREAEEKKIAEEKLKDDTADEPEE